MRDTVSKKTYAEEHPEQDPAEGSREVIDHDLRHDGGKETGTKRTERDKPHSG